MLIVWLDANINSNLCRRNRRVRGSLRAVVNLAEAISEDIGQDLCAYSHAEMAQELRKVPVGIQYYAIDTQAGVSHIGLSSTRGKMLRLSKTKIYGDSANRNRA